MSYPVYSQIRDSLLSLIYFRGGSDFRIESSEASQPLAAHFQLTEKETKQPLESDIYRSKWDNMVRWARNDLRKSGYISSDSPRGIWQLSNSGIIAAQRVSLKHRGLQISLNIDTSKQVTIEPELHDHLQPNSSLKPHQYIVSVNEGRKKLLIHIRRERNHKIVKDKKEKVLNETGKLSCEVCKFDFVSLYGELGNGFCEVHHKNPLSKVAKETQTKLEDLAIVCSNCHRMIHRSQPMIDIEQLKSIIKKQIP